MKKSFFIVYVLGFFLGTSSFCMEEREEKEEGLGAVFQVPAAACLVEVPQVERNKLRRKIKRYLVPAEKELKALKLVEIWWIFL